MPSTSLKDLYCAKSLQDLDLQTVIGSAIQKKSTKLLANSATKVFVDAEKSHAEHDEEKAYVQYMRFVELVLMLKKRSDFRKESYKSILEDANIALSKAESLKESLRKRYSALNVISPKETKKDIIVTELPRNKPEVLNVISEAFTDDNKEKTFITSAELLNFLSSPQISIIIMDIRPRGDFLDSHIKHSCCINIPQDVLNPGLTAAKLESLLPNESLSLWYKRTEVDWVILMDLDSKSEALENNHLNVLKTAMSKWDQTCLKRTPVILKGGYRDWMAKFPMHTTKAIHFDIANDLKFSPVLANLSDIEYPNLDEKDAIEHLNEKNSNEKLFRKTYVPTSTPNGIVPAPAPTSSSESRKSHSAPVIDRKSKPVVHINVNPKPEINSSRSGSYSAINKRSTTVSDKRIPPPINRKSKNIILNPSSNNNSLKYVIDSSDEDLPTEKERQEFVNNKLKTDDAGSKKNLIFNDIRTGENNMLDVSNNQNVKLVVSNDDNDTLLKKKQEKQSYKNGEEENYKNEKKDNMKEVADLLKEQPSVNEKEDLKKSNVTSYKRREVSSAKPSLPGFSDSMKHNYDTNKPSDISNSSLLVPHSQQNSEISNKGLVRSHSSPNITQLLEEEEESNRQCKLPTIDRSLKPKVTSMQLSEVNRARQRNLNPVYGNCPVRPATGLKNLGNTCFMNSVIQCLSNTIPLANYIMSGQYVEHINRDNKHSTGGELVEEFAAVIKALWMGQYKSIYPKDFKNTVSRCLSVCIGNEQQDSHEFLVVLMEKLHADLNRRHVKVVPKLDPNCSEAAFWQHHKICNNSRISDIFDGMLKSTLTCLSCGKTSNSFEVSTCLSLPILASKCTLKDCFKHFLKPEKISGEAAWDCPRCKQKKEAEKRLSICRMPEVLIIQLKRFSYEGLWRRKLQTHVDFDLTFNVPYEENSHEYSRLYSLYGIVNHYGTLEGGHYTAYCKTNSGKWFKYDDHEVSEISSSDIKTSAAYLLFYITSDFQSRL